MLSEYIRAGWLGVCGCRLDSGLDYVQHILDLPVRLATNSIIECLVDLGFGEQWVDSGYAWENEMVFKRI